MYKNQLFWIFLVILYPSSLWALTNTESLKLTKQREHFHSKLQRKIRTQEEITKPPARLFSIIKYPTPIGEMSAYLSKPTSPPLGKKHSAIIWISGGFPAGGMNAKAWTPVSPNNDQSAKQFRNAGIIMLYPFLRGYAGNPGYQEGFLGEVDDIISALNYLKKLDYIDPKNIYLGGHSTGGCLVLLAAALNSDFKAVFSFGPVADPLDYGKDHALHDTSIKLENELRAPINYLPLIKSPTYIIAGSEGNIESLRQLRAANNNKNIRFIEIKGADHFNILATTNKLLSGLIMYSDMGMPYLESTTASRFQAYFDLYGNSKKDTGLPAFLR